MSASFTRFVAVHHIEIASVPVSSQDLLPALESNGNCRGEFLPKRTHLCIGSVKADFVVDMILYCVLVQGSWENICRTRVILIQVSSLDLGHGMVCIPIRLWPKVFATIRTPAILKRNQMVEFIVSAGVSEAICFHGLSLNAVRNACRRANR